MFSFIWFDLILFNLNYLDSILFYLIQFDSIIKSWKIKESKELEENFQNNNNEEEEL